MKIGEGSLVIIIGIVFLVGLLGGIILAEYKYKDVIDSQNELKSQLVQLRQAVKWVSILEQILPELAKDELNLLDEQLRQRKKRENEN